MPLLSVDLFIDMARARQSDRQLRRHRRRDRMGKATSIAPRRTGCSRVKNWWM
jgi:hypothetical protein